LNYYYDSRNKYHNIPVFYLIFEFDLGTLLVLDFFNSTIGTMYFSITFSKWYHEIYLNLYSGTLSTNYTNSENYQIPLELGLLIKHTVGNVISSSINRNLSLVAFDYLDFEVDLKLKTRRVEDDVDFGQGTITC
jgi:hypothetical protein